MGFDKCGGLKPSLRIEIYKEELIGSMGTGVILWDVQIQPVKQVIANQLDIVMVDKVDKSVVIDVAVPNYSNIKKKEHGKESPGSERAAGEKVGSENNRGPCGHLNNEGVAPADPKKNI